ncbi:FkbM family methyltransferase [Thermocoleostomius sinensis]|uniref:FkbM family methyltransferase n=1 Tax=Thermocoleostomius sinensis A174 TaxID=2016057 RepID=A0A9E9C6Y0_9CYAN|nr:FkbM family methyltransferase [Thermocoleostomius sinensis]WAL58683.1 FkbM family methyltransferase [Thermocoleostomius sinensis A174]
MNQLNDPQWINAKEFLQRYLKPGERMVAPRYFKQEASKLYPYKLTHELTPDYYEWLLLHKGQLQQIDPTFLKQAVTQLNPVFANEVFVILTARSDVPALTNSVHLQPLWQQVNPSLEGGSSFGWRHTLSQPLDRLKQQLADPRIDGLTQQLNAVLDRLIQIERAIKKLNQAIQGQTAARPRPNAPLATLSLEELRSTCRASCQTAYLGDNIILCRVLGNYLVYGDTKDVGIVPHLSLNGFWEPWVTLLMMRTVKPGWYCLDVGANHGYYSVVMASQVGPAGRVIALEPNVHLVKLICKTLEVNGFNDRAKALCKAVSEKAGEVVKLVVPHGQTGHASIYGNARDSDEVMDVETVTIDQLTADWPQVNFIKIDVEGAEENVWRGMQETVRRNPNLAIVLEFGANRYANPRAFLEEIVAAGFILRYIDYDTHPKELSIERCLSDRSDSYWDLFLSRT